MFINLLRELRIKQEHHETDPRRGSTKNRMRY